MKKILWLNQLFLAACIVAISSSLVHAKDNSHRVECFKHNIQLQLSDGNGFPVPGTEFWVTLDIKKEGNKVTIQFPVINFQTGPVSPENPFFPTGFFPGGYLYTSDGFLPEEIRPNDLVYRSILAASNNGASQPFSFATPPEPPYANIPAGYILSVTNAGAIAVQCAELLVILFRQDRRY